MKLSVVSTLYHSASYIKEFYKRIKKEIFLITQDYEIIFVNDGSPDNSLDIVLDLQNNDPHIIILDLSRNFGHHKAIMTGLKETTGDFVFLIDCDLEEEPELLTKFYYKLMEKKCDVVYGVQKHRKGKWFEQVSGELFYKFRNHLTAEDIPKNAFIARLMSRVYVNSLVHYQETEIALDSVFHSTGFSQEPFPANKLSKGTSTYTLRKRFYLAINSITSFSSKPLHFIFYTGLGITFLAFFYVLLLIINSLFFGRSVEGWTSLIASIWLLGGVIILFLGIIGIYIAKIFTETKHRPYTIIRKRYSKASRSSS